MARRLLGEIEMIPAFLLVASLSALGATPSVSASDGPTLRPLQSELAGLPLPTSIAADEDEPGSARIERKTRSSSPKTRTAPPREAPPEIVAEPAEPPERSKVAPLIVLGGSVVAAIVGAVFVSRTADAIARDPATTRVNAGGQSLRVPDIDDIRAQETEVLTNGLIATMSLSAAVAGFVTSTLLLVSD